MPEGDDLAPSDGPMPFLTDDELAAENGSYLLVTDDELLLLRLGTETLREANPQATEAVSLDEKVAALATRRGLDLPVPDSDLPEWARARCAGWKPNVFGGADSPGTMEAGRKGLRLAFDADEQLPTLFRFEGFDVAWSVEFEEGTPDAVMGAALDAAIAEVACPRSMEPVVVVSTFAVPRGLPEEDLSMLAMCVQVQIEEPLDLSGDGASWKPKQVSTRLLRGNLN